MYIGPKYAYLQTFIFLVCINMNVEMEASDKETIS